MHVMRHVSISPFVVVVALLIGQGTSAQSLVPGAAPLSPPPPAPPPPPSMAVPKLPQLDAPPTHDYKPARRRSFGDRVTKCLDDAAGVGLGPNERAAYSRNCANR